MKKKILSLEPLGLLRPTHTSSETARFEVAITTSRSAKASLISIFADDVKTRRRKNRSPPAPPTADAEDKVPIGRYRRNKKAWLLRMKLKDAPNLRNQFQTLCAERKREMKMKFKDLITVLQKYDLELDIHVREDWSWYKESGISHFEPTVTKYARTKYNTYLTEDEGDLFPVDMLDDIIIDAVAKLCREQKIEYHSPSYDGEEPSEEQQEIEKTVRDSVEYVYILG